jgi:hypothetical protein
VRAPDELRSGEQAEVIILLDERAAVPPTPGSAADEAAARERLRRFAGAVDGGDARAGDNDRIDADLTRA